MEGVLHRCNLGVQPADVYRRHRLCFVRLRSVLGRPILARTTCAADNTPPKRASRGKAGSAVERLQNNPAYQRLRKTAWKDVYRPTKDSQPPGTVPPHILESTLNQPVPSAEPPSNPYQTQDIIPSAAENAHREAQSAQVSTSGRPPASTTGSSPASSQAAPAGEKGGLQEGRQQQPRYLDFGGQPQRQVRMSRVRFWLNFHTEFGQRIRIVGSNDNLGHWKLPQGAELQWSPGDMWNTIVELPAGTVIEYKYVLLDNGGQVVAWQRGNNSVLAVGHSDDDVEVYDNWEGSPGASVVAAGETTTREGRLLSWATEIEALFASQRSELRKSRMELVAAQDEARLAREESRQFRAELRASEAERVKAELKVKELDVANRLLRSQLSETTLSFRNALETTQQFLLEAERSMLRRDAEKPEADANAAPSSVGPLTEAAELSAPSSSGPSFIETFVNGAPLATSSSNGGGGIGEKPATGMSSSGTESSLSNGVVTRSAKASPKAQKGATTWRRNAPASNGRTVKAAAMARVGSGVESLTANQDAQIAEQAERMRESGHKELTEVVSS